MLWKNGMSRSACGFRLHCHNERWRSRYPCFRIIGVGRDKQLSTPAWYRHTSHGIHGLVGRQSNPTFLPGIQSCINNWFPAPWILVLIASAGLYLQAGICFRAAAWMTYPRLKCSGQALFCLRDITDEETKLSCQHTAWFIP